MFSIRDFIGWMICFGGSSVLVVLFCPREGALVHVPGVQKFLRKKCSSRLFSGCCCVHFLSDQSESLTVWFCRGDVISCWLTTLIVVVVQNCHTNSHSRKPNYGLPCISNFMQLFYRSICIWETGLNIFNTLFRIVCHVQTIKTGEIMLTELIEYQLFMTQTMCDANNAGRKLRSLQIFAVLD